MTITFYLNQDRKHNLYCRISDGKERAILSMGYTVEQNCWDEANETLSPIDRHYYTLLRLKQVLIDYAAELKADGKDDIVNIIKDHILEMATSNGMEGIAKSLFDYYKCAIIPNYDTFISAFETSTKKSSSRYIIETRKNSIYLHGEDSVYILDTPEGISNVISSIIQKERYQELLSETDASTWENVFNTLLPKDTVPGQIKAMFLPKIYGKWREFWNKFEDSVTTKSNRLTLKDIKEESKLQLHVFLQSYDGCCNPISIARQLGDELCTAVILALMEIYEEDDCARLYSTLFFDNTKNDVHDWKKVLVNNQTIYIQKA